MPRFSMESAISLANMRGPRALQPYHTTKASTLDYTVKSGDFEEEQYLQCTFSIAIEGIDIFGPLVMTINEGKLVVTTRLPILWSYASVHAISSKNIC